MKLTFKLLLVAGALSTASSLALGGQAPGSASAPDINATHSDRFYTSDQFSNTVSVVDPVDNKLLGVIKLGDPTPMNLSQLYRGQLVSMKVTEFEPIETTSNVLWIGAIQQVTQADKKDARRYLIIVNGKPGELGEPVQVQAQSRMPSRPLHDGGTPQRRGIKKGTANSLDARKVQPDNLAILGEATQPTHGRLQNILMEQSRIPPWV
jgi:DNA-binding beta-propeller fold protein YncE